jgi:hypothetical protein
LPSRFAAVTAALAAGGLALAARSAPAQSTAPVALAPVRIDSVVRPEVRAASTGHVILWYEPLALAGGIALSSTILQPALEPSIRKRVERP